MTVRDSLWNRVISAFNGESVELRSYEKTFICHQNLWAFFACYMPSNSTDFSYMSFKRDLLKF